jgi:hypothetical protein
MINGMIKNTLSKTIAGADINQAVTLSSRSAAPFRVGFVIKPLFLEMGFSGFNL